MSAPDRSNPPRIVGFGDMSMPACEEYVCRNGIVLRVLRSTSSDAVRLVIAWRKGTYNLEYPEASLVMPMVLEDGAGERDGDSITSAIDFEGAVFGATQGTLSMKLMLTAVSEKYRNLLPLLKDMIEKPHFCQQTVTRKAASLASGIRVNRTRLQNIANIISLEKMWGKGHPAARITDLERLENLTSEDIRKAHREIVLGVRPAVWLTGNVDDVMINDTVAMIESIEGFASDDSVPGLPPAAPAYGERVRQEVPGKNQSYVYVVLPIINNTNPDYYPLTVAITMLGGYFGSRLMQNIREEKGLTYGISCQIQSSGNENFLTIGCHTTSGNEDEVIKEILSEIKELALRPATPEELEATKLSIQGELASRLDSVFIINAGMVRNYENGQDDSEFNKRLAALRDVTPESIMAVSARNLLPDKAIVSVAKGMDS